MSGLDPKRVRLALNWTYPGIFRSGSEFSTFWFATPKWTETGSEKVTNLSHLGQSYQLWSHTWQSWSIVLLLNIRLFHIQIFMYLLYTLFSQAILKNKIFLSTSCLYILFHNTTFVSDPPENYHLDVKKLPKTWHFFQQTCYWQHLCLGESSWSNLRCNRFGRIKDSNFRLSKRRFLKDRRFCSRRNTHNLKKKPINYFNEYLTQACTVFGV